MSLAVRASRTLETAVNNVWNRGLVLVATQETAVAVGATDNNDAKASFSTDGASCVDVAAPGVAVFSTFPNHPFALASQYNRSQGVLHLQRYLNVRANRRGHRRPGLEYQSCCKPGVSAREGRINLRDEVRPGDLLEIRQGQRM